MRLPAIIPQAGAPLDTFLRRAGQVLPVILNKWTDQLQWIMLMVSCVTVSKVVIALELASNARCAMIRFENSAEMFTFDASSAPPTMVPRPAVPEVPIVAVPLARVVA